MTMFDRRCLVALLASVGIAFRLPSPARAAVPNNGWVVAITCPRSLRTFAEFEEWLRAIPISQLDGSPTARCEETGELYRTIHYVAYARRGDEPEHEALLVTQLAREISRAVEAAQSPSATSDEADEKLRRLAIYWRQRPEFDVIDRDQYNPETRQFEPVPGWRSLGLYSRLTVGAINA